MVFIWIEGDLVAHILMKYLLIKKNGNDTNEDLQVILNGFLNEKYNINHDRTTFIIDRSTFEYEINQSVDKERCFLTISSDGNIRETAKNIENMAIDINTSGILKYFHILKIYDGLSEYYCKKLYPKYAQYERKLRYMILIIVTKAYGAGWIENTVDENAKQSISGRAHNSFSNLKMDEILEYLELGEIENYLFLPPDIDVKMCLEKEFTPEKIDSLEKEEICLLLDKIRNPKCLWERVFTEIGDVNEWKKYMKDIHNIRNSVAHQKKITPKQYYDTLKQLNNINCELNSAIEVAVSKEITESKKIDILGSFASLAGKLIMKNINLNIVGDMLKAFSERVNELVKPVEMNFKPEIVDSIRESALKFSSVDITSGYKEAMQNLACSFTAFDSLEGINEAIKSSAEEMSKIGKYWSREEIDAIGTAAKLDDIAYQINQHNEN